MPVTQADASDNKYIIAQATSSGFPYLLSGYLNLSASYCSSLNCHLFKIRASTIAGLTLLHLIPFVASSKADERIYASMPHFVIE